VGFLFYINPAQNSSISLPLAPLFIPKNNFLFLRIIICCQLIYLGKIRLSLFKI